MSARFYSLLLALLLAAPGAFAETLKLPDNLTGFGSPAGESFLAESTAKEAYFPLASNFLTQKTQAYCGVASIVMVLNALNVPAPAVPEYEPYKTFTQDNVLNDRTETILPRQVLDKQGMTLDQIGAILSTQPIKAEVRHASDASLEQFRTQASSFLAKPGHFFVLN